MAKGETTFSTGKVEKKKFNFTPFKAGDYDLKLLGDSVEVRPAKEPTKKQPNPMPWVSASFEALGSAEEEGQKNRKVFHYLGVSLKPDKNGTIGPTRADQLKGLADALGDQANIPVITTKGIECLSPIALKKWLQSHDGEIVKGHVRIQAGSKEYPDPKNVISEFFEPEEGGSEDEEEKDEEADETEEGEEADESDEETDEDESEDEDEDSDEDSDEEPEEDADEDEDELEKVVAKKKTKPSGKPSKVAKKKSKK